MERTDKPITVGPRKTVLGGTPWTIPNIGASIDACSSAYQQYVNRTSRHEGHQALKSFRTAGGDLLKGCEALYEVMAHRLPIASPPIDKGFRKLVNESLTPWEPFSGRWLTFLQFCQHFSVRCAKLASRMDLKPMEKETALMQLLYEMHHTMTELLELSETLTTEPDKGLTS